VRQGKLNHPFQKLVVKILDSGPEFRNFRRAEFELKLALFQAEV
jgi:hypothetical protein